MNRPQIDLNPFTMKPTFSVVTPAWNRAYCVKDSIHSVLGQKGDHRFEVIVFDAGSKDGTADAARSVDDPRVRVGEHPINNGVNFSRNRGIEMAQGEWIVLLDSDDQLTPEAFNIMQRDIDTMDDDVALVFYGTKDLKTDTKKSHFKAKDGSDKGFVSYEEWLGQQRVSGEFLVMVRAEVFKQNLFREDLVAFEKYCWLKIAQQHRVMVHNVVVRLYESDDENRQTKQIMSPEYAAPRADSYQKFLAEFGDDMSRISPKHYAHYLAVMAHLQASAGQAKAARRSIRKAMTYDLGLKTVGLYLCSYLGKWPFHCATRLAKRLS